MKLKVEVAIGCESCNTETIFKGKVKGWNELRHRATLDHHRKNMYCNGDFNNGELFFVKDLIGNLSEIDEKKEFKPRKSKTDRLLEAILN